MESPARRRLLWLAHFAVLAAAYAALLTHLPGASAMYRLALIGGGAFVAGAAVLSVTRRGPAAAPAWPAVLRGALALLPWLGLFALVAARGLWWTQRPAALRFFAEYVLAIWSVFCAVGADPFNSGSNGLRRALVTVAVVFFVLGIQGSAFGLTSFGCGVSVLLAILAVTAFWIAGSASRSAGLQFLTSLVATTLALGIGEGALRLLHAGESVREVDNREYARQFYSLTPPGSAFVNRPKPLDEFGPALIEINSRGIRGPEIRDGRADVLLIGDSFVEARQLPWTQAIGPRLQDALRAHSSPLRVVSHGMRGWSPLLEWNWYLKVGRTFHPRLVMLFFFWNDLWPAGTEARTFSAVLTPDGRPISFDVPVDGNWIWYKHVRLVRLIDETWRRVGLADLRRAFSSTLSAGGALDMPAAQRAARSLSAGPPLTHAELDALLTSREETLDPELRQLSESGFWPGLRPRAVWTDAQRQAAAATETELRQFAADVRADGGRLAIAYVPNPYQVGTQECAVGRLVERLDLDTLLPPDSGIQDWLREASARQHIPLIDPTDAMRAVDRDQPAASQTPLYLRADCHWSPHGHQFMADFVAAALPSLME